MSKRAGGKFFQPRDAAFQNRTVKRFCHSRRNRRIPVRKPGRRKKTFCLISPCVLFFIPSAKRGKAAHFQITFGALPFFCQLHALNQKASCAFRRKNSLPERFRVYFMNGKAVKHLYNRMDQVRALHRLSLSVHSGIRQIQLFRRLRQVQIQIKFLHKRLFPNRRRKL